MTELTIKLIILLIPGALGCIIYEKLTIHKDWSQFRFILNSIILGSTAYFICQLVVSGGIWGLNLFFEEPLNSYSLKVWSELSEESIPYTEVLCGSIVGIILGVLITNIEQTKKLNKFANKLNISTKYGDENLYTHFLNADEIEEVYLRDIKNNLVYHGVVAYFSENENFKEILLYDVSVYEYENSDHLYDIERIYLSMPNSEVIIEKPFKSKENE